MNGLQFGDNEDVEISGGNAFLKMECNGFANVLEELVNRLRLREDIFAHASRAPKLAVVVDFDFYQHKVIL